MLRKNDYVVVGSTGVCQVSGIIEESFSGNETREYYVLEPVSGNASTIYVPTDNDQLCMRNIMSKKEVDKLVEDLAKADFSWNEEDQKRKAEYAEIARVCDPFELAKVIITLIKRQEELDESGRRLSSIDSEALKFSEQILKDELALALGMDSEKTISYLIDKIK